MAAAQYVHVPGYAALLFRKTFPDLTKPDALIPRSKEWWTSKAEWSEQQHRWTFPSGATISFGYLENDDDVYQYQGAAYQFIGGDELTQHTEFRYRYLFSRLRRPVDGPLSKVPLRMRGATNPGGRGHDFVKARFITPATRAPGAVFVPALLKDNPSLDPVAYMESLNHLPPRERAQLISGIWDDFDGGQFKREWLRYYRASDRGQYWMFGETAYAPDEVRNRFLTVDVAATVKKLAKDDPDYTVVSAWGVTRCGKLVWLDCLRLRCEIPDIAPHVAAMYARWRVGKAVIEGGGNQKAAFQLCQRHPSHMNCIEFIPTTDKLDRAAPALNLAEAGRLWLPANNGRFPLEDVEGELLRFTGDSKRDSHDDVVDSLAMAARAIADKSSTPRRITMIGAGSRPGPLGPHSGFLQPIRNPFRLHQ